MTPEPPVRPYRRARGSPRALLRAPPTTDPPPDPREVPMQKKTIRKAYGSLEPEELYRLVVSAAARGDHTECEEIASHCPRVVASIRHPAFDLAVEGTRAMLDAAVPVFAHYLGWLSAIDVVTPSIAQAVDFIIGELGIDPEEPPG